MPGLGLSETVLIVAGTVYLAVKAWTNLRGGPPFMGFAVVPAEPILPSKPPADPPAGPH